MQTFTDWLKEFHANGSYSNEFHLAELAYNAALAEAAAWHQEIADGLKYRAEKTRTEWCGPDVDDEDRKDNYADARNDDRMAQYHCGSAAHFRAVAGNEPKQPAADAATKGPTDQ